MLATVKNLAIEILSDFRYSLKKVSYDLSIGQREPERVTRAVFDRGNGASILLYSPQQGTVILTEQFRLPCFLNGTPTGVLLEVCAGTLDGESPEDCIRREAEEETGYQLGEIKKVFEAYMSPGSVTELIHFFVAAYTPSMKIFKGGGLAEEQEYIEVKELAFTDCLEMLHSGQIRDAKTIILLQYAQLHGLL